MHTQDDYALMNVSVSLISMHNHVSSIRRSFEKMMKVYRINVDTLCLAVSYKKTFKQLLCFGL